MDFYHDGMRELQDRYEGRAIADRLGALVRTSFKDADRAFIESAPFFFLSTATPESVDCSFKGGAPGFVKIVGGNVLEWPDYDGNRQYRSLGNIVSHPRVGLLFIRFDAETPARMSRLRVNGRAEIVETEAAIADIPGAKRIVRVTAEHIFPNCPRYIPNLALAEPSAYIPQAGKVAPEPAWKSEPFAKDIYDAEAKPASAE